MRHIWCDLMRSYMWCYDLYKCMIWSDVLLWDVMSLCLLRSRTVRNSDSLTVFWIPEPYRKNWQSPRPLLSLPLPFCIKGLTITDVNKMFIAHGCIPIFLQFFKRLVDKKCVFGMARYMCVQPHKAVKGLFFSFLTIPSGRYKSTPLALPRQPVSVYHD